VHNRLKSSRAIESIGKLVARMKAEPNFVQRWQQENNVISTAVSLGELREIFRRCGGQALARGRISKFDHRVISQILRTWDQTTIFHRFAVLRTLQVLWHLAEIDAKLAAWFPHPRERPPKI